MAYKRYDEYPAGVVHHSKIILIADPVTGALTKVTMFEWDRPEGEVVFSYGGQLESSENFNYDLANNQLNTPGFTANPYFTRLAVATTAQIAAIPAPLNGMVVYNSTINKLQVYTGTWETITSV